MLVIRQLRFELRLFPHLLWYLSHNFIFLSLVEISHCVLKAYYIALFLQIWAHLCASIDELMVEIILYYLNAVIAIQ